MSTTATSSLVVDIVQ